MTKRTISIAWRPTLMRHPHIPDSTTLEAEQRPIMEEDSVEKMKKLFRFRGITIDK